MEKIILSLLLCCVSLLTAKQSDASMQELQATCLACHLKEQIPDALIYRRYLMEYSTPTNMKVAIKTYLKNPQKENSIMPPPFFLKFPMKDALQLEDNTLEKNIDAFLQHYDIKKKLVLP